MNAAPIRIATRSSDLALWQARHVADLLRNLDDELEVQLVHVSTVGDRDQREPLRQFGGLGVFTREVQKSVLEGTADLAVHSLKDLPTQTAEGLRLAGIPARGPENDALVLPAGSDIGDLEALPSGARIGTGSPRRQAQLWNRRPDLELAEVRGNVGTRLRKLDEGQYDALVLAEAGLKRLGLDDRISCLLRPPLLYAAVGQGALGIECRGDDTRSSELLTAISDPATHARVTAERHLLARLRAGCHAPLGVESRLENATLHLAAVVLSLDGLSRVDADATGPADAPDEVAEAVAAALWDGGAGDLLNA